MVEGYYHHDFDYMKLDPQNIYNLIKDIIKNTNQNLIITQGNKLPKQCCNLKKIFKEK